MKILLYSAGLSLVEKSGVGRAIHHQMRALDTVGVPYTVNPKDAYDVVHINMVFPSSFRMSRKARRQGKKVVYHAHSTEEDFRNSFLGSNLVAPLFKKWLVRCYRSGDLVLTPTPYSKRLLEGYDLGKPIVSLSNGIDLSFYRQDPDGAKRFRSRYGLSESDKVIIAVGLYIERKGIVDFVELARRMPQYRFIWFGYTNPYTVTRKARKAVRTKLDNLLFAGYVSKQDLRDAYSGSNLFLFPTYEETEGIVLLEALAMKCPVLIRDIPIYEDWLTDGVSVYKAGNIHEFQEKAEGILENRLPDLTERGYQEAGKRDIAAIGGELAAQYEALLQTERGTKGSKE